ncbi:hypothetical protein AB6A40_007114 [Gnathostoma spinigerum]|uniref:Notch NODP domain-containing protein n=1 Tax=Gnathostoma spinigerum TaxID=75299 RepID=A0ABD6EK98_9BILA
MVRDERPLIYSWNSESGVGPLVVVPQNSLSSLFSEYRREKLGITEPLSGTMVILQFDVSSCLNEARDDCFTDIERVVKYLGAANAKQDFQDLGMSMYEARVEKNREEPTKPNSLPALVITMVFIFVMLLTIVVVMQQGRKRKVMHAKIWHPQPADNYKSSTANLDSYNPHSGYLLGSDNTKRLRSESVPIGIAHPNLYVEDDAQSFLKPRPTNEPKVDVRQWNSLHEEANSLKAISSPIKTALVNERGRYGRTALMQTACNQAKTESVSVEDVEKLLRAGADIDAQDDSEDTALMLAVKSGRQMVVECLLKNGADPTIVDECDRTPLHHAVAIQSTEITKLLLETRKINVDALDVENRTALVVCAKYDMMGPEIAEMLLRAKADVACVGDKCSRTYDGKTALHFAAQHNNVEIIRVLVENGANKDAQDQLDQTPLFLAAKEGHLEAVEKLICLGASKEITDQKERSPRDVAAENLYMEVVNFLDSVQTQRVLGMSMAASFGHLDAVAASRFKKMLKKASSKTTVKKNSSPVHPPSSSSHSSGSANPLTPPLSDGSTYSTTPSPNSGQNFSSLRNMNHPAQNEGIPHGSSVMLSPYSDHHTGNSCSPPQLAQVISKAAAWQQPELPPIHYEDSKFYGSGSALIEAYPNQRPVQPIYSHSYSTAHLSSCYYNV